MNWHFRFFQKYITMRASKWTLDGGSPTGEKQFWRNKHVKTFPTTNKSKFLMCEEWLVWNRKSVPFRRLSTFQALKWALESDNSISILPKKLWTEAKFSMFKIHLEIIFMKNIKWDFIRSLKIFDIEVLWINAGWITQSDLQLYTRVYSENIINYSTQLMKLYN